VAAATTLAFCGPARAAIVTERDTGGPVTDRPLSPGERRELDMVSVQVTGQERFAMLVEDTFRGNVERLIGHGGLRNAEVVLVLYPAGGERTTIVMRGGLENRREQRLGGKWESTAALRDRRTVKFVLTGSGFAGVDRVEVQANAVAATPADVQVVALHPLVTEPRRFECDESDRIYDRLGDAISAADRLRFRLDRIEAVLARRLRRTGGPVRLRERLRRVRATRRDAQTSFAVVFGLSGDLEVMLGESSC
jgi:hypothetical protein